MDGEREARNEPKPVAIGDLQAMKKAFQARFWKLEEELTPCRGYLEKLLDRVEKDDLRAEKLSEVRSVRDDGEEQLKPVWDSSMALKAIKVTPTIPLPANPEQLRRRLSVVFGTDGWTHPRVLSGLGIYFAVPGPRGTRSRPPLP